MTNIDPDAGLPDDSTTPDVPQSAGSAAEVPDEIVSPGSTATGAGTADEGDADSAEKSPGEVEDGITDDDIDAALGTTEGDVSDGSEQKLPEH
ncbi:hypothetical protein B0I08_103203 [Glaciihabitans tibetensis]|uniref:Uncharacterized protein n=1 Tax=Glaciihabitans tibetensis TaxID=1266600 RepID=A0A2T0VFK8_9MICO|nr:hypothetical protein [Glaciihabitans tibetensis]PRY68997.1 hypothetical protein B0I08_103203 [Glaciihabitans tibetensis]